MCCTLRQHYWLWILLGFVIAVSGAWWYVGRVNSSHPAVWANPGGDAGRRNFAKEPLPTAPKVLWSYDMLDPTVIPDRFNRYMSLTPPVIWQDGTAYVGLGSKVHAVGPDGKRKWAWESKTPISNLALGRQGNVYAQADGMLYALKPDGTMEWQVEVPVKNDDARGLLVGQGGVIYVGGREFMTAVSSTGDRKWRFKGDNITAGPVELDDGNLAVMIGSQLYLLDRDGNTVWDRPAVLPQSVLGLAAYKDRIYVNGNSAHMVFSRTGSTVTNANSIVPVNYLVAIGPDYLQDGAVRFDANWSAPQWRDERLDRLRTIITTVVDGAGNAVLFTSSVSEPRLGTTITGVRMLDAKGELKWELADAHPTSLIGAAGQGRVWFIGYTRDSREVRLICIGDQ